MAVGPSSGLLLLFAGQAYSVVECLLYVAVSCGSARHEGGSATYSFIGRSSGPNEPAPQFALGCDVAHLLSPSGGDASKTLVRSCVSAFRSQEGDQERCVDSAERAIRLWPKLWRFERLAGEAWRIGACDSEDSTW